MKSFQDMVREFHVLADQPLAPLPIELRNTELRANLMAEEPIETVIALVGPARAQTIVIGQLLKAIEKVAKSKQDEPSLIETIDGCMDTLVVTFGTLETLGLTSEESLELYTEVHRSNMAKKGGPIDANGKQQKPPGWTPPDITGVLQRIVARRVNPLGRGTCTCSTFCGGACL